MHQKKDSRRPLIVYYIISLVVVLLLNTLLFPQIERYSVKQVEYSEFLQMLEDGNIKAVEIDQTKISFTLWRSVCLLRAVSDTASTDLLCCLQIHRRLGMCCCSQQ